ncbi:hypothetical protein D3C85_1025920 [compost metagenome]
MNDEELHQHRIASASNGAQDRIEGGLAVDQQAHLVIGQARHAPELGHRPQCAIGFRVARGQGFLDPGSPVQVGHGHVHFAVGLAPGLDVGVEGSAAEYQIGNEGEVGNEQQRQRPGNGPLGRAHGEHCVQGGDCAKQVNHANEVTEEVGAVVIHTHPAVRRLCP